MRMRLGHRSVVRVLMDQGHPSYHVSFSAPARVRNLDASVSQLLPAGSYTVVPGASSGFLVVRNGEPLALMALTVRDGKITEMDVLADPGRLRRLDVSGLTGSQ